MVLPRDALLGLLLLTGACVQTAPQSGPQTGPQEVEARAREASAPDLVRVPGATFLMGSPPEYRRAIEGPQRMVRVDEFWLARYLVTAEQYCEFLNEVGNDGYFVADAHVYDYRTIQGIGEDFEPYDGRVVPRATPRRPGDRFAPQPGAESAPAYPVTWLGAAAYCRWLSLH